MPKTRDPLIVEREARTAAETIADIATDDVYTDAPEYRERVERLWTALKTGIPTLVQATVPAWMYRVVEADEDGDPLDHGVVSAESEAEAIDRLGRRFWSLGHREPLPVRLYRITDRQQVWETGDMTDVQVTPRR